jgi:hypothetical protein
LTRKLLVFYVLFELATSETFSRKKVSNTSKSVQGEGKKRKLLRLSFSSPLLENPPPFSSFSLAPPPHVGRPQNRSGIRNPLTRSDFCVDVCFKFGEEA